MKKIRRNAVVVACLVLALGGAASWAGPPNNDVSDAYGNTAGGTKALVNNTPASSGNPYGHHDTAFGDEALRYNTSGYDSTALGFQALFDNLLQSHANTAVGSGALAGYPYASTALGYRTLF